MNSFSVADDSCPGDAIWPADFRDGIAYFAGGDFPDTVWIISAPPAMVWSFHEA
jgi:hypothetical protein